MTSMHIHSIPFSISHIPSPSAVLHALARKIQSRICTRPQIPLSQSKPHWNLFERHSDGLFSATSLVSLFLLFPKCTPPRSSLLLPCDHVSGTQRLFLAGLSIPRESRATSTLLFAPHFSVLSPISLAILTPNIPESGTKSRVETQVRVTLDLAHASTSAGEHNQYDRVGSWKWLKLPPGTSTKRRTRREGKIGKCFSSITLALALTSRKIPHHSTSFTSTQP